MDVKLIANYLPQYHVIPQNSAWWGEGYTDWIGTKNAKPQYEGHVQPKLPLDGNFYSLDNVDAIRWQARLAREYGITAFAIYHYWFNSNLQLLETPSELMLANKDINIGFFFLWGNGSWVRTWSNVKKSNDWAPAYDSKDRDEADDGVLARLDYGGPKDWEKHFYYLLPFFMDERYVRFDGKPVFGFMQPRNGFKTIKSMVDYWDQLAKREGLPGVCCISNESFSARVNRTLLPVRFRYSPGVPQTAGEWFKEKAKTTLSKRKGSLRLYDYDTAWISILKSARHAGPNTYLSGFVSFDDTPRRGGKARIYRGASPDKLERYLTELLLISKKQGKEYVFLSAWNEWGEGMCLEPDKQFGYGWLEAVKHALEKANGVS